ncbi:hypothetical protein ES703_62224 [subsurface metagenome]
MRVIATLAIDGTKEIRLEGDAQIFGSHLKPWLGDIGIWLENWRYAGHSGPNNKSKVFVPWTSCLMVEELS